MSDVVHLITDLGPSDGPSDGPAPTAPARSAWLIASPEGTHDRDQEAAALPLRPRPRPTRRRRCPVTRPRGLDLADYVRELTQPHSHAEHYERATRDIDGRPLRHRGPLGRNHVIQVPSLLNQLWQNDTPSGSAEEGPRPGFASRPAARLDALDTAVRIDIQAARWITDLGERPRSPHTVDLIHQLHGLVPSADLAQRKAIEKSVRSWWVQARIVTGWDSPSWKPTNTCPLCGKRGSLKIRLAERIGMCDNDVCDGTWDESTIGLLADHIRVESEAERVSPGGVGPCWCPWPEPRIPDMEWQCRRCGSARCTHALRARLVSDARAAADNERMGA